MVVILAEKHSVAKMIAEAISHNAKRVPFPEMPSFACWKFNFMGEDAVIVHARGHILKLKELTTYGEKYKIWNTEYYPLLPKEHTYELDSDLEGVFPRLAETLKSADWLISATDNDREGDTIFKNIYNYLHLTVPYKKAVFDDNTEEAFIKAFSNLQDGNTRIGFEESGICRNIDDFDIGNNLTVFSSLQMPLEIDGRRKPVKIGRVKTSTLNMVVTLEKKIQSHKKSYYYRVNANFKYKYNDIKGEYPKNFEDKSSAVKLSEEFNGKRGVVKDYSIEELISKAPKLYNSTSIQADANKYFGYSPKQTMDALEAMCLKKISTYPRTSSNCLSNGSERDVSSIIKMLMSDRFKQYYIDENEWIKFSSKHFNSDNVEGHPAIIPTKLDVKDIEMNEIESNLYDLLCKSLLRLVMPTLKKEKRTAVISVDGKDFVATSITVKNKGWKSLYDEYSKVETDTTEDDEADNKDDSSDEIINTTDLPMMNIGDVLENNTYSVRTIEVAPPRRYTLGTLTSAMETAGQRIEDEEVAEFMRKQHKSLGTGSTRDRIIDALLQDGYITVKGKSVYATQIGIWIIDNFPVDDLKSVEFTANMEQKLYDVEKGKITKAEHIAQTQELVRKWCSQLENYTCNSVKMSSTGGEKCPMCHANMVTVKTKNGVAWACTNWKVVKKDENNNVRTDLEGRPLRNCNFFLPLNFCGATLTESNLKRLCQDKRTSLLNFKNKEGEKYRGFMEWDKKEKRFVIIKDLEKAECPACKGKIIATAKGWCCENHMKYKEGEFVERDEKKYKVPICAFVIPNEYLGAKFTMSDVKLICKGEASSIHKMKSKEGKEFRAYLKWNNAESRIVLQKDSKLQCPLCGGIIKATNNGWCCEHYFETNEDNGKAKHKCNFYIPTEWKNAKIGEAQLKQFCAKISTKEYTFIGKKGEFTACLKYDREKGIQYDFEAGKLYCPICKKGEVRQGKKGGWYCTNFFDNGCSFRTFAKVSGVELTKPIMKSICNTNVSGKVMVHSTEKNADYPARLYWDFKDSKIKMEFIKEKQNSKKD